MTKYSFVWILIFLQYSNGDDLIPECIGANQLSRATRICCIEQRDNRTLWNSLIECHRPISDEFMRTSAEALCPLPKYVYDPENPKHSIEDVFFNICGLVQGNDLERYQGRNCLLYGRPGRPGKRGISSHKKEVKDVKETWGDDVPCNIGKCVLALGIDLGE